MSRMFVALGLSVKHDHLSLAAKRGSGFCFFSNFIVATRGANKPFSCQAALHIIAGQLSEEKIKAAEAARRTNVQWGIAWNLLMNSKLYHPKNELKPFLIRCFDGQVLRQTFEALDANGDGLLTSQELKVPTDANHGRSRLSLCRPGWDDQSQPGTSPGGSRPGCLDGRYEPKSGKIWSCWNGMNLLFYVVISCDLLILVMKPTDVSLF